MGRPNPGSGVNLEPKTGLISETFAWLNKLKEFRDQVEAFRPTELEIPEHAQIQSEECGRLDSVSAASEWPCRERKGVTPIRVQAREWDSVWP
jgi:hypothetical protein